MTESKSNILIRQRGITLIEVMVVVVISSILILISGVGISAFFRKYKELSAWSSLQQQGLDCLNVIKNGVPVGSGDNMEYYGVTNALKLNVTGSATSSVGNGIKVTPPTQQGLETPDFAHFYIYDQAVRCTYVHHGIQNASPLYIFPKQSDTEKIKVNKFEVRKLNQEDDVLAVQITLQAQIETRKNEYRTIKYVTKMVKK